MLIKNLNKSLEGCELEGFVKLYKAPSFVKGITKISECSVIEITGDTSQAITVSEFKKTTC